MKKILFSIAIIIVIIIGIVLSTGCFGCKNLDKEKCNRNQDCLSVYKPCPEGVFGCETDGTMFAECRDKE